MIWTKLSASKQFTQNIIEFPLHALRNVSIFVRIFIASVKEKGTPLHLNFVSWHLSYSLVKIEAFVKLNIWKYFPWYSSILESNWLIFDILVISIKPRRGNKYSGFVDMDYGICNFY